MNKYYGSYTDEITAMINKKLAAEIACTLDAYENSNTDECSAEANAARLDYMCGLRFMAKVIVDELQEAQKDD